MSRYILKMSLLFLLRDTWNSEEMINCYLFKACQIIINTVQLRWYLLCLREKEGQKALREKVGTALMLLWDRQIQYLDRVDRHSRRFHIRYYAAINECTLRKVKWPTHWCTWTHTHARVRPHINTDVDAPIQRHAQSAERSLYTVCKKEISACC